MKKSLFKASQTQNTNIIFAEKDAEKNKNLSQKNVKYISNPSRLGRLRSPTQIPVTPYNVRFLQRTVGNQAATKLIKAKLNVGQPRDQYKQEADRVAYQVMAIPEPKTQQPIQRQSRETEEIRQKSLASSITPLVQRQPEEEEPLQGKLASVQRQDPEEDEEVLQGKFTTNESPAQFQSNGDEAENPTGMPSRLKAGLETFSRMHLSGIRVHNNSSKPAQFNALAYTQGQDIHVGPGQEKHLPHEGWHVVQQMQGRVKPTIQAKGVSINDDMGLEREADAMGQKALQVKRVEQTKVNPQTIGDTGHIASSPRPGTGLRPDRDSAVGSPSSDVIQRVPLAPAVAAAIKALTLAEAITAVGTVVSSAASIISLVGTAQNDKSGVSPDAILTPTSGDYLMSDVDRDALAQVFRVRYFQEVAKLVVREQSRGTVLDDAKQEQLKQTAIGNVQFKLTNAMSQGLRTTTEEFVQQGDGGTSKETPWGAVTVSVEGGSVGDPSQSPAFVEIAERHHVTVPERTMAFIKRVKLSYESHKDWNLTWNDDIWVRGTKLAPTQGSGLHVGIEAEVAFDWDGDTSRYEWGGTSLITWHNIPQPAWRGPSDPDD